MSVYKKAKDLIDNQKYEDAVELIKPLAQAGDREAQFLMGSLFQASADVEWSDSKRWLESAAKQDHPEAIYYLAITRFDSKKDAVMIGTCESEDDRRAVYRAAELGSMNAQRDLGCFLATGDNGFPKDEVEGRKWYSMAAQQGHVDAQFNVGLMILLGEGGIGEVSKGISWLEKAAASNTLDPASESAAGVLADSYRQG
ncbi:hypothetical protein LCGC14_1863150, partial [marine sediment metagenome]